jgi:hypothetical protein
MEGRSVQHPSSDLDTLGGGHHSAGSPLPKQRPRRSPAFRHATGMTNSLRETATLSVALQDSIERLDG